MSILLCEHSREDDNVIRMSVSLSISLSFRTEQNRIKPSPRGLTVDPERSGRHVAVGLGHELSSVNQLGGLDYQLMLLAVRRNFNAAGKTTYLKILACATVLITRMLLM